MKDYVAKKEKLQTHNQSGNGHDIGKNQVIFLFIAFS